MRLTVGFSGGSRCDFGSQDYSEVPGTSLSKFQHRLRHVYPYIGDVNDPRGGIDKQCRCVLHLRRLPPVVIQDQDDNVGY